jgi:hypothetical protein
VHYVTTLKVLDFAGGTADLQYAMEKAVMILSEQHQGMRTGEINSFGPNKEGGKHGGNIDAAEKMSRHANHAVKKESAPVSLSPACQEVIGRFYSDFPEGKAWLSAAGEQEH